MPLIMRVIVESDWRLTLNAHLQNQMNVKPGDAIEFERRGDEWVLRVIKDPTGLCYHGHLLVHAGKSEVSIEEAIEQSREERDRQIVDGIYIEDRTP